jgi:diamine N-acetyltransferase
MVTLRKIDRRDAELLSRLSIDTFVQAYEGVHSKEDLNSYCRANYSIASTETLLASRDVEAVLAIENTEPAGFYVAKHHPCPVELFGLSTELKQIYVLSSHFGGGIGGELFSHVVDAGKERGSKWLWLCVSDINYRAQAFYKKLGFSVIGRGPKLFVGNDILSSSIMALDIETLSA